MKQIIKNYSFDKTAKTVTFTDFSSISLDRVLLITNVTSNVIVYQFNNPLLGGTAATNVLTLTFDTSAMNNTDKLQIIYDVTSTDPSYDITATRGGYSEVAGLSAGSLNADLVPATEVSAYKWVSLHITGTYSGTLSFHASNDNTNWFLINMHRLDNQSNVGTSTTGTNIIYTAPAEFRYFRCRMTSYTSGTATGTLELFTTAAGVQTVGVSGGNINQGGTWTVGANSATGSAAPANAFFVAGSRNTDGILTGAMTSTWGQDAMATSNTGLETVSALTMFNGTTYDRVRSANTVAGTTGTGVLSSGVLGFDGTNYQRLKVDTSGNLALGASTNGGYTPGKLISAASTNATSIKGSAGTLGWITASNTNASPRYLKIYDKATAPTVGTDVPVQVFLIPGGGAAGAGTNIPLPAQGLNCSLGIAFAVTTGALDSDTGAILASEVIVNYGTK